MTVSLFVQVTVKDYDAWKALYDSNAHIRTENGVLVDTSIAIQKTAIQ